MLICLRRCDCIIYIANMLYYCCVVFMYVNYKYYSIILLFCTRISVQLKKNHVNKFPHENLMMKYFTQMYNVRCFLI